MVLGGRAPNGDSIKVVPIAKNRFGLSFNLMYSNQGTGEEIKIIYDFSKGKIKNIFSEHIHWDDAGKINPKTDWTSTMSFDKSTSPLYNIILHKRGIEDGKKVDEKNVYVFDGEKYIKR